MIKFTVSELAQLVSGKVTGSKDTLIYGVAGIKNAPEGSVTFLANSKYQSFINDTKASAILVEETFDLETDKTLIKVKNPSVSFNELIEKFYIDDYDNLTQEISKNAIISKKAVIGKNVIIMPFANIEEGVEIGDNSYIGVGSYVGKNVKIGSHVKIYPNVTILKGIIIGSRVIIHSSSVIGSDGFGFDITSGIPKKIYQVGTVVIGDDVEIGSNVSIDRARFDRTVIGRGTKIDNLVHIAHNVEIGENCIILALVGVAGSTIIGNNVILAGQAGVAGHVNIGNKVVVTSRAGVTKDIKDNMMVSGFPAYEHGVFRRIISILHKLPEKIKKFAELEKKIIEIQEKISNGSKFENPKNN